MKTNHFKTCIFLIALSSLLSCVRDDDFNVPVPDGTADPAAGLTSNITIAEVKTLYSGHLTEFVSDLILEGYVISSDASGNFYKEIYLQDHPSAPTAGIRLALDKDNLYLTYTIGRKLFIKLQGLFIGEGKGDVLTIGREADGEIAGIGESEIPDVVITSATAETITGNPVVFSEITDAHIGTYVSVSNIQLRTDELGLPFVEPGAFFSSQHTLESCEEEVSFVLETSAYADFSQLIVPGGSGTVSGIVTRDYYGDILLLVLNEAGDMACWESRCDTGTM